MQRSFASAQDDSLVMPRMMSGSKLAHYRPRLDLKKRRDAMTPSLIKAAPASTLEIEADGKLQLSHGRATLQGCDLAVIATLAIDTAIRSIVLTEGIDGMIENVEGIYAELCTEP